jgi:hypothetical protein
MLFPNFFGSRATYINLVVRERQNIDLYRDIRGPLLQTLGITALIQANVYTSRFQTQTFLIFPYPSYLAFYTVKRSTFFRYNYHKILFYLFRLLFLLSIKSSGRCLHHVTKLIDIDRDEESSAIFAEEQFQKKIGEISFSLL